MKYRIKVVSDPINPPRFYVQFRFGWFWLTVTTGHHHKCFYTLNGAKEYIDSQTKTITYLEYP